MICRLAECSNEVIGKSLYCSDSCKTVYNRNKDRNKSTTVTPTVTSVAISSEVKILDKDDNVITGLLHYTANPNMYVERVEPDRLNWGKWMDRDELKQAGFKANRVSIPGDWDYRKAG